ncbi:type I restriction enzyme HsdR N-terminal domain-containing protein [Rhodohalobacter sp. 614A]|uniref:type I restriction enzyme HsdR N-terminal domain-containing protein n=1 Tax=Rhodohalobacter sp. 614A TaxID=2908649 RepID=UPI001F289795|nr:type I restriction enzyme HsdR N-terminal domain-containing protein [Rhodohalobacter sp. 614A]
MKSVSTDHFPRVVARPDRFWLFNPILKKRYENRPEERVRLCWVEYILHQTKWSKSRIGFEAPIKVSQEKNTLRADLILYSKNMEPAVLVECKSNSVKLNQAAAEQAARYNSQTKARHMVLTNGLEDYWFEIKGNVIQSTGNFFEEDSTKWNSQRNHEYWHQRGFCSSRIPADMKHWLTPAINTFWKEENTAQKQYLDFGKTLLNVPMNQYYNIFDMGDERKLALTFLGYGTSDNYVVSVLNFRGVNQGVLVINLNLYQQKEKGAILLINGRKRQTDLSDRDLPFDFDSFYPKQIETLPRHLINFF